MADHSDLAEYLRTQGHRDIIDADEENAIQAADPLPEPFVPTAAQVAAHNHTSALCKLVPTLCGRPPVEQPSSRPIKAPARTVPLIVGYYCTLRDSNDADLARVFVCRLYPARAIMATMCEHEGADEPTVIKLANFIKASGYQRLYIRATRNALSGHSSRKPSGGHDDRELQTMKS